MKGKKHMHMVSWDKINKPTQEGGLGLWKLTHMSKSCLAKLGWKFYKGDKGLWLRASATMKVRTGKRHGKHLAVTYGNGGIKDCM